MKEYRVNDIQCYTKDGRRSTAYAVQTGFANRLMLLCSKGMVVSDKLKGLVKVQVSVKELNESEPSDEVSKRLLVVKSIEVPRLIRLTVAVICLLAMEQPA